MTKIRLMVSAGIVAMAMTAAAPAWAASDSCDLNGAAQPAPAGTNNFFCGNPQQLLFFPPQDTTGVGENFSLIGSEATAVGTYSLSGSDFTFIDWTIPATFGSTAVGAFAMSNGDGSVALGDHSMVGSVEASFGGFFFDKVSGGTALGSYATVQAIGGTSVGAQSVVTGSYGVAAGFNANASGQGAIAIGGDANTNAQGAQATAAGAVALGADSSATAANSVAIGAGSVADQADTVSVGSTGNERRITNVADGVALSDAATVGQLQSVTGDVTGLQTDVTDLQSDVTDNTADIATNTAAIATNTADIAELQGGLADTNGALADLGDRVDALEAIAGTLDSRFREQRHRAEAGTATAVALSGAMFLPGKTFNLTGNVGTYHGAVAGAIQFGAMVSQSVALNAGVAKGFNRGGKTAARAGFTFGW